MEQLGSKSGAAARAAGKQTEAERLLLLLVMRGCERLQRTPAGEQTASSRASARALVWGWGGISEHAFEVCVCAGSVNVVGDLLVQGIYTNL